MRVDYRYLNKASPKDYFPIPHIDIDMVVDSAAKHMRLSLVDGYSGYNQIMMDEDDQEKRKNNVYYNFCNILLSSYVDGIKECRSNLSTSNDCFIS